MAVRSIVVPVALLVFGVVALTLTLVAIAAGSQNRLAIESKRHLAGSALRVETESVANYVRDYATWNDAVRNLVVSLDETWADDNVGTWASESLGMDASLVLGGQMEVIFGSLDGVRHGQELTELVAPELADLVASARQRVGQPGVIQPDTTEPSASGVVSTYLELDGIPAIAVAAAVRWEDQRPIPLRDGTPVVLVFMRRIDASVLDRFETMFLLPETRLAAASEAPTDSIVLRSIRDREVARLVWSGHRPGTVLIRELAPALAGIGILAAILLGLILHRARGSTAELARSHRELEAKTRAIEDSAAALRTALAEADRANSAKSEFLARMSHELRTPLNAILGFSEIIAGELYGPNSDPRYREYGQLIHASGDHLRSLINDILDLSRIEAGRYELVEEVAELTALVEQCLGLLEPQIRAKRLEIDHQPAGIRLRADTRALKQILLNLISNAVKFTEPGGRISVSTSGGPQGVSIAVSDDGCGMTEADLQRAFELFGQGRASVARNGEGVGLGLYIAKALVEMHDGSIAIESRLGAGTTVTIGFDAGRLVSADALAETA
jgi:signal transduction histidine kinase